MPVHRRVAHQVSPYVSPIVSVPQRWTVRDRGRTTSHASMSSPRVSPGRAHRNLTLPTDALLARPKGGEMVIRGTRTKAATTAWRTSPPLPPSDRTVVRIETPRAACPDQVHLTLPTGGTLTWPRSCRLPRASARLLTHRPSAARAADRDGVGVWPQPYGRRHVAVAGVLSRLGAATGQHACGAGSAEVVDVVVQGARCWVGAVAAGVQRCGGPVEPLDEGLDASFGRQLGNSIEGCACAVELAEAQLRGEGVDTGHGDAAVGRLTTGGGRVGVGILGGVGGLQCGGVIAEGEVRAGGEARLSDDALEAA